MDSLFIIIIIGFHSLHYYLFHKAFCLHPHLHILHWKDPTLSFLETTHALVLLLNFQRPSIYQVAFNPACQNPRCESFDIGKPFSLCWLIRTFGPSRTWIKKQFLSFCLMFHELGSLLSCTAHREVRKVTYRDYGQEFSFPWNGRLSIYMYITKNYCPSLSGQKLGAPPPIWGQHCHQDKIGVNKKGCLFTSSFSCFEKSINGLYCVMWPVI